MNRKTIIIMLALWTVLSCQDHDVQPACHVPARFGNNYAFMDLCLGRYDLDRDGILTEDECSKVKEMDVSGLNLFSLEGIGNFTGLEALFCTGNVLSDLDVSSLPRLKYLYCNDSNVHRLDVSGCGELLILDAHNNFIEEIDISSCPEIFLLSVCFNPRLEKLDLSNSTGLGTLYCQSCALSSLDVSPCPMLTALHCWGNCLTELDMDGCSSLMDLWCGDNDLRTLDVTSCPDKMEYISCPRNPGLMRLYMRHGQTAASIELSDRTAVINK